MPRFEAHAPTSDGPKPLPQPGEPKYEVYSQTRWQRIPRSAVDILAAEKGDHPNRYERLEALYEFAVNVNDPAIAAGKLPVVIVRTGDGQPTYLINAHFLDALRAAKGRS